MTAPDQKLVLGAKELGLNIALFLLFAFLSAGALYEAVKENRLNFVEISFAAQNLVFCAVVLLRRPAKAVDGAWRHQAVALLAFFSGLAFFGAPLTQSPLWRPLAQGIVILANLLAIICLINLGRSFGILIACRHLRTNGLYSLVRHPMYSSDLLLRLGYVCGHPGPGTFSLLLFCAALYAWRAILEEEFLSENAEYETYMKKVRFRFIPGVY